MNSSPFGARLGGGGSPEEFDAIVVGAGLSGMYMLYRLREIGLSVRVYETGDGVGGTWHWNRYPGARVDAWSMQYSYSFSTELEQEWHWSEDYSPQSQILDYANHVADRFDLRPYIQFETTVTTATYDREAKQWIIRTDRGEVVAAKYFIAASGCLSATNVPDFPGVESFEGAWFHTSRWPRKTVDLTGRVGIIGTGSSGIQVISTIADQTEHLFVFQRTPNFVLPAANKPLDAQDEEDWKRNSKERRDAARYSGTGFTMPPLPTSDRSALSVPDEERARIYEEAWHTGFMTLMHTFNDFLISQEANDTAAEFVRSKIRQIVKDPEVGELLCPKDYPIGTKRVCVADGYYETFNRDNVTLVDVRASPIIEITPTGLRTTAATYELDVIIFATGFDAITGPLLRIDITGRDQLTLKKKWEAGPRTYLGLMSAGFPNLFMITGPGSPGVKSNMATSIEQHVELIADTIVYMRRNGYDTIEPVLDAEDAWTTHVGAVADETLQKRANSYYMGANIPGKPRVFLPYVGGVGAYRMKCEEVVANGYEGFALGR